RADEGESLQRQLANILSRMEENVRSRSETDRKPGYFLPALALMLILLAPALTLLTESPYGWGPLPVPLFGLAFLSGFLLSVLTLERALERRNRHFARQSRLMVDMLRYLRLRASSAGADIQGRMRALEHLAKRAIQEKRKRAEILRPLLPALVYCTLVAFSATPLFYPSSGWLISISPAMKFAFIFISFFCVLAQVAFIALAYHSILVDFVRHERDERNLLELSSTVLIDLKLARSPLSRTRYMLPPDRNAWRQLLSIGSSLGLYGLWLLKAYSAEVEEHFRGQVSWEEALLEAARRGFALPVMLPEEKVLEKAPGSAPEEMAVGWRAAPAEPEKPPEKATPHPVKEVQEPPAPMPGLKDLQDDEARRKVLFHALLMARLDGDYSPVERRYRDELIESLDLRPSEVRQAEDEVSEYLSRSGFRPKPVSVPYTPATILPKEPSEDTLRIPPAGIAKEALPFIPPPPGPPETVLGRPGEKASKEETVPIITPSAQPPPPEPQTEGGVTLVMRRRVEALEEGRPGRAVETPAAMTPEEAIIYAMIGMANANSNVAPHQAKEIRRQIERADLSPSRKLELDRQLHAQIPAADVAKGIRDSDLKRTVFFYALLTARLEGDLDPQEKQYRDELVAALALEPEDEEQVEADVTEYLIHRGREALLEAATTGQPSPAPGQRPPKPAEEVAIETIEEAIIYVMIGMANADGNVADAQWAEIHRQIELAGLTPIQRMEIERHLFKPIPASEAAKFLRRPEDREAALFYALLIAYLDGEYRPEEGAYLDELVAALGLTEEDVRHIEADIDEYLAQQESEAWLEEEVEREEEVEIEREVVAPPPPVIPPPAREPAPKVKAPVAPPPLKEEEELSWREKRFLNIMEVQRQVRVLALASVLKLSPEDFKEYVYKLASAGLFTGYADWNEGVVYARKREEMAEECPNCKAPRQPGQEDIAKCPFCGVELFSREVQTS
ncbi:MAG: DUF533 domain-containing protein, partial [Anaerolineae bacterium]